ncbi:MAG: CbiX/SirB N-terminal domain-containing protein [Gammaproteobacteria bacterium]|nr:CbiX/SirB N-terminal domain-containing protein [Gammaproteobacteria bacterium]
MKKWLIIAHGSRLDESNQEVIQLSQSLAATLNVKQKDIHYAFLELARPSIPEGLQNCINEGGTHIVVLPYFLTNGTHVKNDIPHIIRTEKEKYAHVKIDLCQHIGAVDSIKSVILDQLSAHNMSI